MDRGIATKENIELIISRGYSYILIERRAVHKDYVDEFKKAPESFKKIEDDDNCKILCLNKRLHQFVW